MGWRLLWLLSAGSGQPLTPVVPAGYGIEHAQCVPPSEFSEPSFITESYQTLHPISSEELLSLKYESDFPSVLLREAPQDTLQADYFSIKQEVVTPDNMCMGRASRGEAGLGRGLGWIPAVPTLPCPGNGSGAVRCSHSALPTRALPCPSLQGKLEEGPFFPLLCCLFFYHLQKWHVSGPWCQT